MKSYNVQVLNQAVLPEAKRPWIKPSIEIIALESATAGTNPSRADAGGGHYGRTRS